MAKILYLTQVLPYPLDSGAKVRQYYMMRHLARHHEVTLVSFSRPDDPPSAVDHLAGVCQAVYPVAMRRSVWRNVRAGIGGVLTGQPMVVARDEIGEMKATIRRLVQQTGFDAVHADQLSMAGYGQYAAQVSGARRPKTLLDAHNAVYVLTRRMAETEQGKVRRMVMQREARAFARYETAMCRSYDALLTVTQEDQEHLLALFAPDEREHLAEKFTAVPICVDPEQAPMAARRDGHPPTILHLGTMFWPPNISGVLWFAAEVLPRIHEQVPEARFVVIGKNPPREVETLTTDPRVQVTGYVADLLPYLEQTDVFVVPLHAGSGMRVKILDAWLWGLPVVSTPIGAEGIEVQDGDTILLAEDAATFAQATLRLLKDEALNRALRDNGRAWVEAHYGWQSVYEHVDRVYSRLLGTGGVAS